VRFLNSLLKIRCNNVDSISLWPNCKYVYCCTVKLYDILRVKNAFVKSVFCVAEYKICTVVQLYICTIVRSEHGSYLPAGISNGLCGMKSVVEKSEVGGA
jgi:hypothetical protein